MQTQKKGYGDLFSSSPPTGRRCFLQPPSLRQMELRIGTKRERCLNNLTLWGCYELCSILVPFDFAQDREFLDHARDLELVERPVERPYHDLRTNGGGLEKRTPYPVNRFWTSAYHLSMNFKMIPFIKLPYLE